MGRSAGRGTSTTPLSTLPPALRRRRPSSWNGDANTLETDNLPNTTLWVQGNGIIQQNATLTVAPGLTNDGTILLESQNAAYSDTLATGSGTFTNASDGTIHVAQGSGGPRTITGTLVNQGQINVDGSSYLDITGTYDADWGLDRRSRVLVQLLAICNRQLRRADDDSVARAPVTRWRPTTCPTRRCGCRATASSNKARR